MTPLYARCGAFVEMAKSGHLQRPTTHHYLIVTTLIAAGPRDRVNFNVYMYIYMVKSGLLKQPATHHHGVAWIGRIDKIIGLFCKTVLLKRQYSAKETYDLLILLTVATP